jgi:hypothetical protein
MIFNYLSQVRVHKKLEVMKTSVTSMSTSVGGGGCSGRQHVRGLRRGGEVKISGMSMP